MFIISIILKTDKPETDDALIRQPAPHTPSPDCLSIFAPFYGFHLLTWRFKIGHLNDDVIRLYLQESFSILFLVKMCYLKRTRITKTE